MKKIYRALFALGILTCMLVKISFAQCTTSANAIYVAPNATGSGTAASPTGFLTALAISSANPSRTPIIMQGGDYNFNSTIYIPSGINIEGAFSRNGSVWSKNPSSVTNLNVYPSFQYATVIDLGDTFTVAHIIGIDFDSVKNISVKDVNLLVSTSNSVELDTRDGFSVYGVYAYKTTGVQLLNMTITTCDAQNGGEGARGEDGQDALYTQGGGLEVNRTATTNAYQPVYEVAPGSTQQSAGGVGGFGGPTQQYVPCMHLNCLESGCELQSPAPTGSNGGSTYNAAGGAGGTCGQECNISCYLTEYQNSSQDSIALEDLLSGTFPPIIPASQVGVPGTNGSFGHVGQNSSTPGIVREGDQFYIPGTGGVGGNGYGGSGGGGGGAGGVTVIDPKASPVTDPEDLGGVAIAKLTLLGIVTISNAAGQSICGAFIVNLSTPGGPGGGGGEGGHGGGGGGGGGAVYGIYAYQSHGITAGNMTYSLGNAGTGGVGGDGGQGGAGALGYPGAVPSSSAIFSSQQGATGGNGGDGGAGGAGQNGANGKQYQTWKVSQPSDVIFSIDTSHLCTNSVIGLTYNSPCRIQAAYGTGNSLASANVISTTPTYEEISIPDTGDLNIIITNPNYNSDYAIYDFHVTRIRPLPTFYLRNHICANDTVSLVPDDTTAEGYLWQVYENGALLTQSRAIKWNFIPPVNTGNVSYRITLQEFTTCCGWSTPASNSFTIEHTLNLAIAATGGVLPPYCAGVYTTMLTLTGAPVTETGTFPNYVDHYYGVTWSTGDTSVNTINISQNGTYSVTYKSPGGCITHSQQNYTTQRIYDLPQATPTSPNYLECQYSTISVQATSPDGASFNFYNSPTATTSLPGGGDVLSYSFSPFFGFSPNIADSIVLYTATVDYHGCIGPNRGKAIIYRPTFPPTVAQPFTSFYHAVAGSNCNAQVSYQTPTGLSACVGYVRVSHISGLPSGSAFPLGVSLVVNRLTDEYGNYADITTTIEVVDTTAPYINNVPPATLTFNTAPGTCATIYHVANVTATDNCSGTILPIINRIGIFSGDTSFGLGTTQYTYAFTDSSGNTSTAYMAVTVIDNQAPVLTCPANQIHYISGSDTAVYVGYNLPTVTDNCIQGYLPLTFVSGFPQSGLHPVGTTTQTFTSVDNNGNVGTCSFTIQVKDTIAPVLTCPGPLSFLADTLRSYTTITYPTPTAIDNLGGPITFSLLSGKASGDTASIGLYTAIWQGTDANGNTSTCPVKINVGSHQAPNLVCPQSITTLNDSGLCTAKINYTIAPAYDVDGHYYYGTLTAGRDSGAAFPFGTTNVVYEAIDAQNNHAYCSFNVTVKDTIKPIFTTACPHDTTVNINPLTCGANITPPVLTGKSYDCVAPTIGLLSGSFSGYYTLGTTVQQYRIVDDFGNYNTCSYNVTVIDNNTVTVTCPHDISVSNDPGKCSAYLPSYGTPVILPNYNTSCITAGLVHDPGPNFPVGTTQLTYNVLVNGQTASCSWNITVNDVEKPHITSIANITTEVDPGSCGQVVNFTAPVGTDNCTNGLGTYLLTGLAPGSLFPFGSTLETYVVSDLNGHTDTARFTVTVLDTISPVIAAHVSVTDSTSSMCGKIINFTAPVGTDNSSCATTTLVAGLNPGDLFPLGTTQEIYVVKDSVGNTDTCKFNITVRPIYPLQASCVDNWLQTDLTGQGAIVYYPVPGTVDQYTGQLNPCAGVTIMLVAGQGSGAFFSPGPHAEQYVYIVKGTGDTVRCTTNVIVTETTPPSIDCGTTQTYTIAPDSGVCTASFRIPVPAVSDNGGLVTLTHQIDGVDDTSVVYNFSSGFHTIAYRATDYFSNSSYCSIYVNVIDNFAITNTFPAVTYCQNEIADIDPGITGYATGLTYAWKSYDSIGNPVTISTSKILHFNAVQLSNYNQYHIVVTDRCGASLIGNEFVLRVTPAPATTLTGLNTAYCITDGTDKTVSFTPAGGILAGSGLTGNKFNPRGAGLGPHTVTYSYTDTVSGCTGISSITVTVYNLPTDSLFADSLYCINAIPVQLPTTYSTYTGAGITGTVFTPATAGSGYHLLTRTVAVNGCSVQLVQNVRVNSVIPNATITAPASVCEASGLYTLQAATSGGAWAGASLVVDSLTGIAKLDSRAAGAGNDTVVYTVTKSACTSSNTVVIHVLDNSYTIPYSYPRYCTTSPPVLFDTTGNKSYFGVGFRNNTFYPDSVGSRGPVFYAIATVNNLGCRDTFVRMINLQGGQLDVYSTQYVCKNGDSLYINLGNQYDSIRWGNGSTSNQRWFADTGSYPVFLRDTGGCYGSDTLHIGIYSAPSQIVTSTSVYACPSDSALILADSSFINYLWSNGNTTQSIMALPGNYTVTVTTYHGCKYQSPPVSVTTGPDVIAPTITCAPDTVLYAPAGSCSVTGIGLSLPAALDNCGLSSVTSNAPTSYPVGVTHVIWTARDYANNTKTCSQKVTVNDTIKPYFTTEPAIGLVVDTELNNCSTRVPNLVGLFTASDSCSGVALSQSPAAGTFVTTATTSVLITARDSSGNTISYYMTFITGDTVSPVIACPSNITTTISGAATTAVVHYTAPTHATNCSNSTVQRIGGLGSGATFPIGVTTERYVVTDGTGAADTCSFTVTVTHVNGIVETTDNNNSLAVMPVPATDHLTVVYKNNTTSSLHIKLMNAMGQIVHEESITQFNGDYNQTIDLKEQAAGTYILEIVSDNEIVTREIVKL